MFGVLGLVLDVVDVSFDEDSEGLLLNFKVGFGVVGVFVVLLVLVIGLFWCWRKWKNVVEE